MVERNQRKTKTGVVVSNKMNKTVVIRVMRQFAHSEYGKVIRRFKKFYAHDEKSECGIGDVVSIVETRPISKSKHWRVTEVVTKAQ